MKNGRQLNKDSLTYYIVVVPKEDFTVQNSSLAKND